MSIYSYVVRYDSGFAPNPFYGICSVATCKHPIRKHAKIGDWLVGCGSADKSVRLGGHLVYAMRITEDLTFEQYNADPRFDKKKPVRNGSRKQSAGDNIYYPTPTGWSQRDSFHSNPDGSPDAAHISNDTQVNRVLLSETFVYFGGQGPAFPDCLRDRSGTHICKRGIGRSKFDDPLLEDQLVTWLNSVGLTGLRGSPFEWSSLRRG